MVEKAEILSKASTIEGHTWAQEEEPEGNAKWSGKEYGASFEFTKPEGFILEGDVSTFALKLMGKAAGRDKLKSEFVDALGKPMIEFPSIRFRSQLLIWNNSEKNK